MNPTPAQVQAWWLDLVGPEYGCLPQHIRLAEQAATWAALQERQACVEYLRERLLPRIASDLSSNRSLTASGLKQKALSALHDLTKLPDNGTSRMSLIRRALEALPDDAP